MKGKKCPKKIKYLCLFLVSLLFCSQLLESSASATSITSVNGVTMTFRYCPIGESCQWRRGASTGNLSIPQTLIDVNASRSITTLYGLGVDMSINEGSANFSNNQYRLGLTLRQNTPGLSDPPSLQEYLGVYAVKVIGHTNTGRDVESTTCGYEIDNNNQYISHICYINLTSAEYLRSATWSLGDHNQTAIQPDIGYVMQAEGNSAIILSDLTLVTTSSNDPLIDGQQQLINNTNIINSNIVDIKNQLDDTNEKLDDVNNNLEDINDTLTDSTVTGDFSMPDVPAFGPIATIVNSIIDLPRVFLNPGSCVDLQGPMPVLTDQTFIIPCPKKLLEPFWDAVVIIEEFFAAYIWFRTAVYIARQVKKLRDPTNDDEEYLDI